MSKHVRPIVDNYRENHEDDAGLLPVKSTMWTAPINVLRRNKRLDWLKADTTEQGNLPHPLQRPLPFRRRGCSRARRRDVP